MSVSRPQDIRLGGCLCGDLRYRASELIDAGYCHCRLCQRSSGSPVLAWVGFPASRFSYTKGEATIFASSDTGRRDFCARCGTQIAFRSSEVPDRIDVNIASLDDPAGVEPEYHIWVESQISWFEIDDDLPRFPDDGPDPALERRPAE